MIEITGEGKSAVATPDGTSRKKKKKTNVKYPFPLSYFLHVAGHSKSSELLLWQNMQIFQSIDAISDELFTAPSVDIIEMFQPASLPAGRLACKKHRQMY